MFNSKAFLFATATAAVATGIVPGLCGVALAQVGTHTSTVSTELEEIIVTAQKRSESINDVPLSIVAASGDLLAALGIKDPADLTKIVPGFQAVQSQIGTPVFFLRGVGYNDVSIAARPSVTMYVDEAPLPYSVMTMGSTLDLERVEVLKGPQGLLFGANSTGGAINFIAAKPTSTLKYGVDASIGRFYDNSLSAFISGPLTGGLNARLAVSHQGGSAWQYDYVDGDTIGATDITSARFSLDAQPTDRLRMLLSLSGTIDKSEPQLPQFAGFAPLPFSVPAVTNYPIAPRDARATSFNPAPVPAGQYSRPLQRDSSQWQVSLRGDYDVTDEVTLTSLTNYARNKQDYGLDGDGSNLRILDFTNIGTLRTFSQELRASGQLADRSNWIVGGNLERAKTDEIATANINDSSTATVFGFFGLPIGLIDYVPVGLGTKFDSEAVFANLDYKLASKLTVHSGVRYTQTKTTAKQCEIIGGNLNSPLGIFTLFGVPNPASQLIPGNCFTLHFGANGIPTPQEFNDSLKEDNVSWRVGVDYTPTDDTLIYASVSRGYKAGAYASLSASVDAALLPATQEKLTSYEVGAKVDVVPGVMHVNAAAFYYDYGDKQLQGTKIDAVFGPLQALINIPKSRVQGFEFEATLRPTESVTLGGSVTYVDSEVVSSFANPTRFGVAANFKGSSFPNTPKWQAGANAQFRKPLSSKIEGFIGGNLTYRSESYGDFIQDARLKIPSYVLVDGQIGAETDDKSWLVQLYGRNIFNKYYVTNQIFAQESLIRYTGRPATYGVRVSYRY